MNIVLVKFFQPLNFATSVTHKHDTAKVVHAKPLSWKELKL